MQIEVSNGEILDKLSILEIKKANITDLVKIKNIDKEYAIVKEHAQSILPSKHPLYQKLLEINRMLWKIEDDIRICERNQQFDAHFIELARAVYFTNDKRAEVKKQINLLTHSELVEVKSYENLEQNVDG